MAIYIWVNIGLDNGLLHEGANPLPESLFTCASHMRAISQLVPRLFFQASIIHNEFENCAFEITTTPYKANELNLKCIWKCCLLSIVIQPVICQTHLPSNL